MKTKNNLLVPILIFFSSPILLLLFQPKWELEGLGLILGFWGKFISPILLLVALLVYIKKLN